MVFTEKVLFTGTTHYFKLKHPRTFLDYAEKYAKEGYESYKKRMIEQLDTTLPYSVLNHLVDYAFPLIEVEKEMTTFLDLTMRNTGNFYVNNRFDLIRRGVPHKVFEIIYYPQCDKIPENLIFT